MLILRKSPSSRLYQLPVSLGEASVQFELQSYADLLKAQNRC